MSYDEPIREALERLTTRVFEPPGKLSPGAQDEAVAMLRAAMREGLPAGLTAEQARASLDAAIRKLAFNARTRAWPIPSEVLKAVQETALRPVAPPKAATDDRHKPRPSCEPPYDAETRDLAQLLAAAIREHRPIPERARYDGPLWCAIHECGLTEAEIDGWSKAMGYLVSQVPYRLRSGAIPAGVRATVQRMPGGGTEGFA